MEEESSFCGFFPCFSPRGLNPRASNPFPNVAASADFSPKLASSKTLTSMITVVKCIFLFMMSRCYCKPHRIPVSFDALLLGVAHTV